MTTPSTGLRMKEEILSFEIHFVKSLRNLGKKREIVISEEKDANFSLCMDFVQSNLKYHRFLTPDSHKLNRSITGLIEKFQIHCQQDKANCFRNLVDGFLGFPLDGELKSETHYALLSLLLNLSNSPLAVDYNPSLKRVEKDAVDQFDWTSYLLEGVEDYSLQKYDEDSDWTDEEEEVNNLPPSGMVLQEVSDRTLCEGVQDEAAAVEDTAVSRLKESIVVQYWNGKTDARNAGSSHESSTLRRDWDDYLSQSNELHSSTDKTLVTEYHIIRELIWLLSGAKSSFIFHWDGVQFITNPEVMVSHLTDNALSNLLRHITRYGTIVQHIQDFIRRVVASESTLSSLTHQALAETLSSYLCQLKDKLIPLEKRICRQEECHTIMNLLDLLAPDLRDLEQLNRLLTNGIQSPDQKTSLAERTVLLLTETHSLLMEVDLIGDTESQLPLMFNIWVKILRPYLEIIDNWITYGQFEDFHSEFIIRRNHDASSLDEDFWNNTCSVEGSENSIPDFLKPAFHKIILAGRSVELLQNFGRLDQVIKTAKSDRRLPLYNLFIQSVSEELGHDFVDSASKESSEITTPTQSMDAGVFAQLNADGMQNHFLSANFRNIFKEEQNVPLQSEDDQSLLRNLENLKFRGLSPTNLLLERCLYPHISNQYQVVCRALLKTLKEECKLMHHFSVMRKIYLMEAGDMMYDFYTVIFEKLRLKEAWQDVSFLNISLQESVHHYLAEEASSLFVDVGPEDSQRVLSQPSAALKALRIHYNVSWPVNIIINSACVEIYSQTFSFLLQIKHAKFRIDGLNFTDLSKEGHVSAASDWPSHLRSAITHRMQMFRMRLMHFINSLHQYIMTRILHSTGMEFQEEVEHANDLDEVMAVHQRYLTRIHDRCLLHHRAQFIHQIVIKILNMALVFSGSWEQGVNHVSLKSLKALEEEFSKCLQFLSSFLNNYIKRGSFPHLEAFAFGLLN